MSSKHGLCISLVVEGLFGRNRKVRRETFTLAETFTTDATGIDYMALVTAKLFEIKAKPGCAYAVVVNHFEDKEYAPEGLEPYIMRSMLLRNETLARGTVEGK